MMKFWYCPRCCRISTSDAINKATREAFDSKAIGKINEKHLFKGYEYCCPHCKAEHSNFWKVSTSYSQFLSELADMAEDWRTWPDEDSVIAKVKECYRRKGEVENESV